ncbi:hypothetical protein [Dyadobacter psychrophilus]|uniref:Uncharacterized protein n=1 Tax=Dyadobacter psychrophilus TaxID=651661 RepID=A0A1T5BWP8_9BACT|nr:hypothetical protein [Dyadobacter psychrophilus]SKB51778.1 hypothetical protein SAMN05660293_00681 [Dyadobacter psychrophilus]
MSPVKFTVRKRFHLLQCKTRRLDSGQEHLAHYRLIFVLAGEGKFILNREIHSYVSGGVIFLEPDQQPTFQEDKGTEILMIAFDTHLAHDFQQKKAYSPDFADTYKQVENLCKNIRLSQGMRVKNDRDAQTVSYLVGQISFELSQQSPSFIKLIKSSIDLIVTILVRNNFESKKADEPLQQNLTESMIGYLKSQMQQNKSVRIGELLIKFNVSEEAANLCMLNHTGMSLRNFIFKYKADLFKSRMLKMDVSDFSARV